jgi:hypothetical protein
MEVILFWAAMGLICGCWAGMKRPPVHAVVHLWDDHLADRIAACLVDSTAAEQWLGASSQYPCSPDEAVPLLCRGHSSRGQSLPVLWPQSGCDLAC